jgi:hypothetical protein
MLLKSIELIYTSVLASSERRIQTRCENTVKMVVKLIRKGILHNRVKVRRNGRKWRNTSLSPCRKWG